MRMRYFAFQIVIALANAQAMAQSRGVDFETTAQGQAAVEDEVRSDAPRTSDWRIAVGGGVAVAPTYPGSDGYRAHIVPLAQVTYKQFFAGASGIGINFYRDKNWQFRASLAPSRGRDESDDAALNGLGKIDSTIRAGMFASYRAGRFDTRMQINSDIAGKHQGTLARLDLLYSIPINARFILSAGPGVTWASNDYTQSFFGVTPDQSARSGLPVYDAAGGLNSVRVSASALYRFDRRWLMAVSYSLSELRGDAAKSPITQSTTQNLFFAGALYRF